MIGPNPLLGDMDIVTTLLRDADGNVRGAVTCWAIALCAFIVLRVPRQVLMGCLLAAAVTVGLAAIVIEARPTRAVADATRDPPSSTMYRGVVRVPAEPGTTATQ